MTGKISEQELDFMRKDDPIAAAVWELWIAQGKASLVKEGVPCKASA